MAPPPGSDVPKDILYEGPRAQTDDDVLFGESIHDSQDDFNARFDDLNGDPLVDDDDLI